MAGKGPFQLLFSLRKESGSGGVGLRQHLMLIFEGLRPGLTFC